MSLIIRNPLYLSLTISVGAGLISISSAEYFNWIQAFILAFCSSFLYMWLIYKDNGIEVFLGIYLVYNLSPLIIQTEDNLIFTGFNPLFINTPALSPTMNLILILVTYLAFYLIYFKLTRQRSRARGNASKS